MTTELDPQELAFRREINSDPRNRGLQLVYADWLEERGDRYALAWRNGFDSLGGRGGLGGRVGRVGRGGLVGLVGLGGLLNTSENIVLIPGENVLVFLPHGYGFSVL